MIHLSYNTWIISFSAATFPQDIKPFSNCTDVPFERRSIFLASASADEEFLKAFHCFYLKRHPPNSFKPGYSFDRALFTYRRHITWTSHSVFSRPHWNYHPYITVQEKLYGRLQRCLSWTRDLALITHRFCTPILFGKLQRAERSGDNRVWWAQCLSLQICLREGMSSLEGRKRNITMEIILTQLNIIRQKETQSSSTTTANLLSTVKSNLTWTTKRC